jgi:hypothetical protein
MRTCLFILFESLRFLLCESRDRISGHYFSTRFNRCLYIKVARDYFRFDLIELLQETEKMGLPPLAVELSRPALVFCA